jgi:hypothetical protein
MNCSKPSASISLLQDRLLAVVGEGDALVRALDALLDPDFSSGLEMCMNSTPSVEQ